ncbi:S-adenosyl-L-methionine-dependent methyltransferase [Lasiosphaeria miniovina]|uniref:S-adenosyl-L-methionine-dependent methyltransferase n=1 Tax=Lasiosphaeria miniovina TaxID=1954250 RepID=A0AA40DUH6_9PEZI|nr:S-adenosyl-L-methionine-dependent methyltransferase [Lasiosphaeria miniovina]KAK0713676.1 S-adenosyl-L-methionine-dependent methyltransferase [Lasiosphaeria miniovina]
MPAAAEPDSDTTLRHRNPPAPQDAGQAATHPPKTRVSLTGVSETMLATLSARADYASYPSATGDGPFFPDPWAKAALDRLAWDSTQPSKTTVQARGFNSRIILRANLFDLWTAEFLAANPDADKTVLHLACGLDSRALRLQSHWAQRNVRWIDADVPDVVALRRQVVPFPDEGCYSLIELDVTSNDWLQRIPADRPTLVVMEGLIMYLTPEDAAGLLRGICDRFADRSGQIVCDVVGKTYLRIQAWNKAISRTGAVMTFGVDDAEELAAADSRLRVRDHVLMWQLPGQHLYSWWSKVVRWCFSWIPGFGTLLSDVRLEF